MPTSLVVEVPPEEHAQMLTALRRARSGSRLAGPSVWWCAAGRTPTASAAALFCSRCRVYRTVQAYRTPTWGWNYDAQGRLLPPLRPTVLVPRLRRSLVARLKATPRASGWWRTRWRGAPLALPLQAKRGGVIAAETRRRWLHELGWVGKRAKRVAKADDPHRVERWARLRSVDEQLNGGEAMVFADDWASHLWPTVGCAWMPTGPQRAGMTPGQHQPHDLAGARELSPGTRHDGLGPRPTTALFRDLRTCRDARYPADRYTRLDVVVATDQLHTATAVEPWRAPHPRGTRLLLPTSCPRANPMARAFGDVHDGCPRHHQRQR
jgi:hypothetical protein